jgi:hypothetical protein
MHPDIDNGAPFQYSFYVPVQKQDFHLLPHLRPGALFSHGESVPKSDPVSRSKKIEPCGVDVGGSGGL